MHMAKRWAPDYVFMPCFVPEGVLHPFQALGVKVVFYKLTESLDVDLRDLKEKMEANEGKRPLVVVINYFGFESWINVSPLAHRFGGILLAIVRIRSWVVKTYPSAFADAVLYSLNKFLPVVDGALIGSRNSNLDLSIDHTTLPYLPRGIMAVYEAHLRANAVIAAASSGTDITDEVAISELAYETYYRFIDAYMQPMAQSEESRATEAALDLWMMTHLRNINSQILASHLDNSLLVREAVSAAFAYPIRCHGKRELMRAALMDIGVLPSILKDRWDHVPAEGFEIERSFIDDHLLLPIDGNIDPEMLLRMAKVLDSFTTDDPKCQVISLH